jgi:hypothetical protein
MGIAASLAPGASDTLTASLLRARRTAASAAVTSAAQGDALLGLVERSLLARRHVERQIMRRLYVLGAPADEAPQSEGLECLAAQGLLLTAAALLTPPSRAAGIRCSSRLPGASGRHSADTASARAWPVDTPWVQEGANTDVR